MIYIFILFLQIEIIVLWLLLKKRKPKKNALDPEPGKLVVGTWSRENLVLLARVKENGTWERRMGLIWGRIDQTPDSWVYWNNGSNQYING